MGYREKHALAVFSEEMERELRDNAYKGDFLSWKLSLSELIDEIEHHKKKLLIASICNDRQKVREYSADIANYCLKISQLYGGLEV